MKLDELGFPLLIDVLVLCKYSINLVSQLRSSLEDSHKTEHLQSILEGLVMSHKKSRSQRLELEQPTLSSTRNNGQN